MGAEDTQEVASTGACREPNGPKSLYTKGHYIQYGCGVCAPDGWLNFDASPRLRFERWLILREILRASVGILFPTNVRVGDIVRGLPVADFTAAGVYSSHVLEHLARDDLPQALSNTFRIFMPGALFRLVIPDLQWRASRYLLAAANGQPFAADDLMKSCNLGRISKAKDVFAFARDFFGNSAHLWMYDFSAMRALLRDAGFVDVRRCEFGDSRDPMFALVEERSRFFDGSERELAIEAARPGLLRLTSAIV